LEARTQQVTAKMSSIEAAAKLTAQDKEAPMAYVRSKKDYENNEVKFEYEKDVTSTKTVRKQQPDGSFETEVETTVEKRK
jgi:hypothetical protein